MYSFIGLPISFFQICLWYLWYLHLYKALYEFKTVLNLNKRITDFDCWLNGWYSNLGQWHVTGDTHQIKCSSRNLSNSLGTSMVLFWYLIWSRFLRSLHGKIDRRELFLVKQMGSDCVAGVQSPKPFVISISNRCVFNSLRNCFRAPVTVWMSWSFRETCLVRRRNFDLFIWNWNCNDNMIIFQWLFAELHKIPNSRNISMLSLFPDARYILFVRIFSSFRCFLCFRRRTSVSLGMYRPFRRPPTQRRTPNSRLLQNFWIPSLATIPWMIYHSNCCKLNGQQQPLS